MILFPLTSTTLECILQIDHLWIKDFKIPYNAQFYSHSFMTYWKGKNNHCCYFSPFNYLCCTETERKKRGW